jgi:hypothetical protein
MRDEPHFEILIIGSASQASLSFGQWQERALHGHH